MLRASVQKSEEFCDDSKGHNAVVAGKQPRLQSDRKSFGNSEEKCCRYAIFFTIVSALVDAMKTYFIKDISAEYSQSGVASMQAY